MTTVIPQSPRIKHRWLTWLLTILAGIAVNLLLRRIAALTGLPLYVDCVGTVFTAILGGYIPGMMVGYLTNLLLWIWDESALYYSVISVHIAIVTVFFARRGCYRSFGRAIRTVPFLALVGGGLGSVLTYALSGMDLGKELSSGLASSLHNSGMTPFMSQLTADLLFDLADKLLVVIIVMVILHFLPDHLENRIRRSFMQQHSLTPEERKDASHFHVRKISLRPQFVLLVMGAMSLIALVITVISFMQYRNTLIDTKTEMGRGVTRVIASYFDPDKVDDYLEKGYEVTDYASVREKIGSLRDTSDDITYVYVYQIREDGCHVVFDPDTGEGSNPGDILPFDVDFRDQLPALLAGGEIRPIESNASWGWLYSIYTPVKDSTGKTVCYACADISMDHLAKEQYIFFAKVFSLFMSFTLIVLAVFLLLADNRIIEPINTMAFASSRFAFDSEEQRNTALEQLKTLGIHTGDEIENLYDAISKTTEDSVHYIAETQQKSETIARMQENLILVLADMVESRDQFTGDHVKNTSEYTRIIMEQMRKEGSYTDQLTDEFINNVYHAAPLHDIGKIRVSDAVLNKPGKLTDEEFEAMKLHTLYGADVIEKARKASSDISYLDEARNLAVSHHEKWNGKGYPYGLAGEEIPLSARIMAVADVFDALVSKRSYKDPFPFEKAMDIIREGMGSHFDPKVAEAFIHAEDEVRKVLSERQSEK